MTTLRSLLTMIGVIAALLIASAANADWENTRWGMTPDELKAAVPNLLDWDPPGSPEEAGKVKTLLWKQMFFDGHLYGVRFSFIDGKLRWVQMTPFNVTCDKLEKELISKYGPTEKIYTDVGPITSWHVGEDRVGIYNKPASGSDLAVCEHYYVEWFAGTS